MRAGVLPLRDTRGVAAVEFAIVAPMLMILFLGLLQVGYLYRTEAKLNMMVGNAAEMVAVMQEASSVASPTSTSTATVSSLNDVCQFMALGLAPLPGSGLVLDIASVTEESGPGGLPTSAAVHTATATYDIWEQDYSVTGGTCTAAGASSAITSKSGASAPISIAEAGLVLLPCDNAIIVQASLPYAGPLMPNVAVRPHLTQTAYTRWVYASNPLAELLCPSCTVTNTATQTCNSSNTAATN